MVTVEKRKTATICSRMLATFSDTNNKREETVEELQLLVQQSRFPHREVSAMGLFVPSRKLMLSLASFCTSNVIVLLLVHYGY